MRWYKLMLVKSWIDRGRGLTSYFNEIFLILGTWTISKGNNPIWIIAMILGYGLLCLVVGWCYFHFGFEIAEREVQNQYNQFARDIRVAMNVKNDVI